jgi:hypothetical protein
MRESPLELSGFDVVMVFQVDASILDFARGRLNHD